MAIATLNPNTGETLKTFEPLTSAALEERLQKSVNAFATHKNLTMVERARSMTAAAEQLSDHKRSLAETMTTEMGKTIGSAEAEVEKCALVCRYYAANAAAFLADEPIQTEAAEAFVRHIPIGPVLAVMPWNFPLWQVFRFAAPTLMAGNTALLKHASNVPQCALAIEDIFARAGFADGVFQTLLIDSDAAGEVVDDERVRAVTVTGSEAAGRAIASRAANAIKKSVLELGGSDPFIVMPSADLEAAVETAVTARTMNNGQSCIAAKRFIVHRAVADRFREAFVARMEALSVGDPMDPETDVGPLSSADARDELIRQLCDIKDAGGRVLTGGVALEGPGFHFAPTVVDAVPHDCAAAREELFGPVALMFEADDLSHAIAMANDTRFGLGSAIFTQDETEMRVAVDELDAGSTFINAQVASDPRLPFGGVKASGYGRELARDGILEFVNRKTVSRAT